jgi:diaphanous 1
VQDVKDNITSLKKAGTTLEAELRSLLAYYGENADSTEAMKPEDFFGLIMSFSSSLQVGVFTGAFQTIPGY